MNAYRKIFVSIFAAILMLAPSQDVFAKQNNKTTCDVKGATVTYISQTDIDAVAITWPPSAYIITKPGTYCLKENLAVTRTVTLDEINGTVQPALIRIDSDDVILNLNGKRITQKSRRTGNVVPLYTKGVSSEGRNYITIKNGTIKGFDHAGIELLHYRGEHGENHRITNVSFTKIQNDGIMAMGSKNIVISKNRFSNSVKTAVHLHVSENPLIDSNLIKSSITGRSSYLVIDDLQFTPSSFQIAIYAPYTSKGLIKNNSISVQTHDAMYAPIGILLTDSMGVSIQNNTLKNFDTGVGIGLTMGKDINLIENKILGNAQDQALGVAIISAGGSNISAQRNTIRNGFDTGIRFLDTPSGLIADNTICGIKGPIQYGIPGSESFPPDLIVNATRDCQ